MLRDTGGSGVTEAWAITKAGLGMLGTAGVVLLCLAGIVLACLSLSGTWLVCAAAALAAPLSGPEFPGWWTVAVFVLIAALVEALESVAGFWGVQRRGGSKLAGVMALVGGLGGMLLGGLVPPPGLGALVGMLAGSFALVYWVEKRRLRADQAAHVAMGAVIARVLMILLKVTASLGMTGALWIGMLFW